MQEVHSLMIQKPLSRRAIAPVSSTTSPSITGAIAQRLTKICRVNKSTSRRRFLVTATAANVSTRCSIRRSPWLKRLPWQHRYKTTKGRPLVATSLKVLSPSLKNAGALRHYLSVTATSTFDFKLRNAFLRLVLFFFQVADGDYFGSTRFQAATACGVTATTTASATTVTTAGTSGVTLSVTASVFAIGSVAFAKETEQRQARSAFLPRQDDFRDTDILRFHVPAVLFDSLLFDTCHAILFGTTLTACTPTCSGTGVAGSALAAKHLMACCHNFRLLRLSCRGETQQ